MFRRATGRLLIPLACALAVAAALVGLSAPADAGPSPDPSCSSGLVNCIVFQANHQYGNADGHRFESPLGSNCNYFTNASWHAAGATACSGGYWSEEWCMDFSRWVYNHEGASVANLTHLAYSAKDYPTYQTWDSGRRPRVGDLAVWRSESHVGIVVAVTGGGLPTVVSGNAINPSDGDRSTAIYKHKYTDPQGTFQGFAAPTG